jgi:hypothetical protein
MRILSDAGEEAGLKAAAEVAVEAVKFTAERLPSKKIPPSVSSRVVRGIAYVSAGGVGGRQAPNAYMFEEQGARHPLFGNKKHWYDQPYRPFMEAAIEASADEMAEVFADVAIDIWMKESG